jgi:phage terminase small subunit
MPAAKPPKLTAKERRFVEEFLSNERNATAAYRKVYNTAGNPKTVKAEAYRLLNTPAITAVIAKADAKANAAQTAVIDKYALTVEEVMDRWCRIASANPNDIVQHRRGPHRYCNGIEHAYQWKTVREFQAAVRDATEKKVLTPTDEGGYGYKRTAPINPDCPECAGEGSGYMHAVDTRELSGDALMLYAGTKQTKDGLEIKMQDQSKALESIGRHLGMFVERAQMIGKDGQPVDPGGTVLMIDYGDGRGPRTAAEMEADKSVGA